MAVVAAQESRPGPAPDAPGDETGPGRRGGSRAAGWWLAALAALTVVLGLAIPLAPVIADDPVVTWPKAGTPAASTSLPLTPYRPLQHDRRRAVRGAAPRRRRAAHPAGVRRHARAGTDGRHERRPRRHHELGRHGARRAAPAGRLHLPDRRRPGGHAGGARRAAARRPARRARAAGRRARHRGAGDAGPRRDRAHRRPLLLGARAPSSSSCSCSTRSRSAATLVDGGPAMARTRARPRTTTVPPGGRRRAARVRRLGGARAAAERRLLVHGDGPGRDADGLHRQPNLHVQHDGEPVRAVAVPHGALGPPRRGDRPAGLGSAVDAPAAAAARAR